MYISKLFQVKNWGPLDVLLEVAVIYLCLSVELITVCTLKTGPLDWTVVDFWWTGAVNIVLCYTTLSSLITVMSDQ